MTARPCPICKRPVPPEAENRNRPFCSERCRLVDLGRWLSGDYAVPAEPVDPDELPRRPPPAED